MPIVWFAVFLANVLLIFKVYKQKKIKKDLYANALIGLVFIINLWVGCGLVILLVQHSEIALFFHEVKYVAIMGTPLGLYYFITKVNTCTHKDRIVLGLYTLTSIVSLGVIFTNNMHHLFRRSMVFIPSGINIVETNNGPYYYIVVILNYSLLLIAGLKLFKYCRVTNWMYRKRAQLILMSVAISFVTNIIFQILVIKFNFHLDFTPLTFGLVAWLFYYSLYVYENNVVGELVTDMVMEAIGVGAIFLDSGGKIVYVNPVCEKMFQLKNELVAESDITILGTEMSEIIKGIMQTGESVNYHYCDDKIHVFKVFNKEFFDEGTQIMGNLIIYRDITELEIHRLSNNEAL